MDFFLIGPNFSFNLKAHTKPVMNLDVKLDVFNEKENFPNMFY